MKIPARYEHFVFGVVQSGLTCAVAAAIATTPHALDLAFAGRWLNAWALSWVSMLPVVVLAGDTSAEPAGAEDAGIAACFGITRAPLPFAEAREKVWQDITDVVTYSNGDQTQYLNNTFRARWIAGEPRPADGENTEAAFFGEDEFPPMSEQHDAAMRVLLADAPECGMGPIPAP